LRLQVVCNGIVPAQAEEGAENTHTQPQALHMSVTVSGNQGSEQADVKPLKLSSVL